METAVTQSPALPLAQRINFRLLLLLAVVLAIVGYPVYLFVDSLVTGGVWQKDGYVMVDLKAMSDFEMPQVGAADEDIPSRWRQLDGQRVLLVGEMVRGQSAGRDSDFDLCYSIAKCCFTGAPKIQHFVKCEMPAGKDTSFYPGYVEVLGKLHVSIERQGSNVLSVYRMDVESVKPKT